MQIIINAGGTGTRLWPYSTNQRPKQFIPLIDDQSFLEKTYLRLKSSFEDEQIWINTNQKFEKLVMKSVGESFSTKKILTEPEKRDHFAALIGHSAVVASRTSRTETLLFLHADHLIYEKDWGIYNQALKLIDRDIQSGEFEIITAGVRPSFPNTQLGYIELKPEDKEICYQKSVKVAQFREKPNYETALEFLESGLFLWNLGYYCFTFDGLIKNLERLYPELVEVAEKIYQTGEITPELYSQIPKTSFDYAISEKAESLGVVGLDVFWEDIGSWEIASKYLPKLEENQYQTEIGGNGNQAKLLDPKKKVAFVGVSNLMLIESEEGILVIDPKYSAEVKKVAEYFENLG